jgi:hypothetical protein
VDSSTCISCIPYAVCDGSFLVCCYTVVGAVVLVGVGWILGMSMKSSAEESLTHLAPPEFSTEISSTFGYITVVSGIACVGLNFELQPLCCSARA